MFVLVNNDEIPMARAGGRFLAKLDLCVLVVRKVGNITTAMANGRLAGFPPLLFWFAGRWRALAND